LKSERTQSLRPIRQLLLSLPSVQKADQGQKIKGKNKIQLVFLKTGPTTAYAAAVPTIAAERRMLQKQKRAKIKDVFPIKGNNRMDCSLPRWIFVIGKRKSQPMKP